MSAHDRLAGLCEAKDRAAARIQWPSLAWRGRHLEFARDVLGRRVLATHQCNVINAYYSRDRIDMVYCTGQKMGKTEDLISIQLIDFAIEPNLNGFIYGPKIDWIDEAHWPRFAKCAIEAYYPCADCMPAHRSWVALSERNSLDETPRPPRCPQCSPLIPSTPIDPKRPEKGRRSDWLDPKSSEAGLHAPDGRSIRGYAARKIGGKGGLSGCVRFYLDESSDIANDTRDSISGNMSGGGKCIAPGNMLHRHGWFYNAFRTDRDKYTHVIEISSRQSPNVPKGHKWSDGAVMGCPHKDRPIPGMATIEGIESNLARWKGTTQIEARIDAKAPDIVAGQVFDTADTRDALINWKPVEPSTQGPGVLQLGVDPARRIHRLGIAVRRGNSIIDLFAKVLNQPDHNMGVALVMDYVRKWRKPFERKPIVAYDGEGPEGIEFGRLLKAHEDEIEIHCIRGHFPPRRVRSYYKLRDELAFHFATWIKSGGTIPPNDTLEGEMEVMIASPKTFKSSKGQEWITSKVPDNDEIEKLIGRSPDAFDACKMAAWPVEAQATSQDPPMPKAPAKIEERQEPEEPRQESGNIFDMQASIYSQMWGQS